MNRRALHWQLRILALGTPLHRLDRKAGFSSVSVRNTIRGSDVIRETTPMKG